MRGRQFFYHELDSTLHVVLTVENIGPAQYPFDYHINGAIASDGWAMIRKSSVPRESPWVESRQVEIVSICENMPDTNKSEQSFPASRLIYPLGPTGRIRKHDS